MFSFQPDELVPSKSTLAASSAAMAAMLNIERMVTLLINRESMVRGLMVGCS